MPAHIVEMIKCRVRCVIRYEGFIIGVHSVVIAVIPAVGKVPAAGGTVACPDHLAVARTACMPLACETAWFEPTAKMLYSVRATGNCGIPAAATVFQT
jgi:hypothetical protein